MCFLWPLQQVTDGWGLNYTRSCDSSGGQKSNRSGSHGLRASVGGRFVLEAPGRRWVLAFPSVYSHLRGLACCPSSIFRASHAAAP